jgi:hypothetical protein
MARAQPRRENDRGCALPNAMTRRTIVAEITANGARSHIGLSQKQA